MTPLRTLSGNDSMISNTGASQRQIERARKRSWLGLGFLLDTGFQAVLKTQPMKPLSESGFSK